MRHKFIITLTFLLPLLIKSQTCILIVVSRDTVVIGADSKVGIKSFALGTNIKVKTPFYNTIDCKIRIEKGVFYVAAGRWVGNFLKYGKESIIRQTEFIDTLFYLTKESTMELENDLENSRLYDNKNFMEDYKHKGIGRIDFVWFYHGLPKAYGFTFRIVSDSTEKVKIKIDPAKFNFQKDKLLHFIPLGTYNAISSIYIDDKYWKGKTLEQGVNKLLSIQSDSTPATVGPPFSIVRITKNEVRWYNYGECK